MITVQKNKSINNGFFLDGKNLWICDFNIEEFFVFQNKPFAKRFSCFLLKKKKSETIGKV